MVDNASIDGSAEMVQREFPEVQLFALPRNLGFAGGINRALRDSHAAYALVLNPDTELTADAVHGMLEFLEHTPAAAAAGPLLVGSDGRPHLHLYRRFPSVVQLLLFWTVLGLVSRHITLLRSGFAEHHIRGRKPVQVAQLPGAAMMMRGEALREVGAWDEGFFIWFEDVDWCFRARQKGFSLHVLPTVPVQHGGGSSFASWDMQKRVFQFYRAFFRFLCKHRLERLRRIALPVITADLWVREVGLRIASLFFGRSVAGIRTLAPTRTAIHAVVDRYAAGQLVSFESAES